MFTGYVCDLSDGITCMKHSGAKLFYGAILFFDAVCAGPLRKKNNKQTNKQGITEDYEI